MAAARIGNMRYYHLLRQGEQNLGELLQRFVAHGGEDESQLASGEILRERRSQRPRAGWIVRHVEHHLAFVRCWRRGQHLKTSRPVRFANALLNLPRGYLEAELRQLFGAGNRQRQVA